MDVRLGLIVGRFGWNPGIDCLSKIRARVQPMMKPEPASRQTDQSVRSRAMLYWAMVFLVLAIVAAVFGFGGIAAAATTIAKVLFLVFLVVFLASLITGLTRRRRRM
jgi:uncharacterized membrane protein YtjA (UPF0391 family)